MNDDFDMNRDRDLDRDDIDRDMDHDDMGAQGASNQAKGNMRNAAGKVEEGWGKLTGQEDVERKGQAKQVEGKAQNLGGRVQSKADDALDDLRDDS